MFGHLFKGGYPLGTTGDGFLITGAFLVAFEFNNFPRDIAPDDTTLESMELLASTISIPDVTIQNISYKTVKYFNINVPGKLDYGSQTLSIKFFELRNGLITKFFTRWFNYLRPSIGVNRSSVIGKKLKANIMCVVVDKYLKNIPFACIFAGCYPTKLPSDVYSADIMSRNIQYVDIQFSYDVMLFSEDVIDQAKKLVDNARDNIRTNYSYLINSNLGVRTNVPGSFGL